MLVNVPPLLADLIRHAAAARGVTLAEAKDSAAADLIILGPAAPPPPPASPVPVLTISPDLTHITGPNPADRLPFTPDTLATLLRRIAAAI